MKLVYIIPGGGESSYCENCLRDLAMVGGLRQLGHDAMVLPLYLPLPVNRADLPGGVAAPTKDAPSGRHRRLDRASGQTPIFFGGINVYLQQRFALFRKTPRWLDWLLDRPRLLRLAARRTGMVAAGELGEATLSMLRGEEGRQAKELERLAEWLAGGDAPEIVCLSNGLLAGMARRIRQQARCRVVCLLGDEDEFLDALPEPWRGRAWDELRRRAGDIDLFLPVSRFYAEYIRQRLALPPERVRVVHPGLDAEAYGAAAGECQPPRACPQGATPAIGFLSRLCAAKGLGLLVEAFGRLKREERFRSLRLRLAGGHAPEDAAFLARLESGLRADGLRAAVDILPNLDLQPRLEFLRSLTVLSVPSLRGDAFGLPLVEAMACGVPVVQPNWAAFPEILEGGGGLLVKPGSSAELAHGLAQVLTDAALARQMGQAGRQAVLARFSATAAAQRLADACQGAAV